MSVINNVLKEIENKPSAFTPLELADVPNAKTQTNVYIRTWVIGFLLLALIVLAVFFFSQKNVFNMFSKDQIVESVSEVSNTNTVPVDKILIQKEQPVTVKKEITGLQLNEEQNFLELTLQLPLGAQSFLKQSGLNRYVFFISNAGKQVVAPEITDNAWLTSINVSEVEAGLEIQFFTKNKVLVETLHQEKEGSYLWAIRLKKPTQDDKVKVVEKKVDPNIKSNIATTDKKNNIAKANITTEPVTDEIKPDRQLSKNVKLEIKPVLSGNSDAERLAKADIALQQKAWSQAQKHLQDLLNSSVDKKVRIKLLSVYQQQHKSAEMKLLLGKSLQLYPKNSEFFVMDAGLLFTDKKYSTLIKNYNDNLDDIKIINLVAASYQRTNQHKNAANYYQESLRLNFQQPRQWISLAISQEQLSKFDRSIQSYKMALKSGALNERLETFIHKRLQQLSSSGQ